MIGEYQPPNKKKSDGHFNYLNPANVSKKLTSKSMSLSKPTFNNFKRNSKTQNSKTQKIIIDGKVKRQNIFNKNRMTIGGKKTRKCKK